MTFIVMRLRRTRRRVRLVSVGLCVIVVGGWLTHHLWQRNEPRYGGQSLNVILRDLGPPEILADLQRPVGGSNPRLVRAADALGAMGTNALPTLLRMLGTPDSRVRSWLAYWARRLKVVKIDYPSPYERRVRAINAFNLLGPEAEAAVPRLVQLSGHEKVEVRDSAVHALRHVDASKIPAVDGDVYR